MKAWRRKTNARMKISRPRRITVVAGEQPLRFTRAAESAAPSPASQRNNGAAKPPRIRMRANAVEERSVGRVQASSVCHSIISSTARPRAQSR
jgi:hypothetical protein